MKRIGITGQSGFVGTHLATSVVSSVDCELIPFKNEWFENSQALEDFVAKCDVVIHLAGLTRHPDGQFLYDVNVELCRKLVEALEAVNASPLVMFSSSIHEMRDIPYGRAKLEGGRMFADWAERHNANFIRYIFPNVYGPGAKPFYCSFVANFAYQLTHGEEPHIQVDAPIRLVYVENLCRFILSDLHFRGIDRKVVPFDVELKVSEVLSIFRSFIGPDGSLVECPKEDGYMRDLWMTLQSYREVVSC